MANDVKTMDIDITKAKRRQEHLRHIDKKIGFLIRRRDRKMKDPEITSDPERNWIINVLGSKINVLSKQANSMRT